MKNESNLLARQIGRKLIIIMSYGGQEGKSTLSQQLFQAHMPGSVHCAIETTNDAAGADVMLEPTLKSAKTIETLMLSGKTVILDIGTAEAKNAQNLLKDFQHLISMASAIVVPCRYPEASTASSVGHVIETIQKLIGSNFVRPNQIYIVPNMTPMSSTGASVSAGFDGDVEKMTSTGATFVPAAGVWKSATYDTIRSDFIGEKLAEIAKDDTDFLSAIGDESLSLEERELLMNRYRMVESAKFQLAENLQNAFNAFCDAAHW